MKRICSSIPLVLLALLPACGDEQHPDSGLLVGQDYAQCEGRPGGGVDRSEEVMRTIETHLPTQEINCTDKKIFTLEGREVFFVYVAYGPLSDCPAGCFSSGLCAIYDPPQSLLYDEQNRLGLTHPLVGTQAFQDFRNEQKGSGRWRFCFTVG